MCWLCWCYSGTVYVGVTPAQFSGARLYQPLGLVDIWRVEHWPTPRARAAPPRPLWLGGCVSLLLGASPLGRTVAEQSPPRRRSGPAALERLARCAVAGASEARLCHHGVAAPPPSIRAGAWMALRTVLGLAWRPPFFDGGSRWSCRGQSSGFQTAAPGAQLFGLLAFVGFMGLSVPRGTAAQSSPRAGSRFGVAARAPRHQHSGGRIHSHWKLLNLTVGLHPKDFCDPLRNSLAAGVPARVCRQQPESGASSDAPRPCSS